MEKKIRLDVVIFLLVSAIILTALTTAIVINKRVSSLSEIQSTFSKLKNLDELVKDHYIGILDSEELSDNVARGYVRGMGDEYAQYFTKAEHKAYMSQITGEYEGVGVSVVWKEGEGMFAASVVDFGSVDIAAGPPSGYIIPRADGGYYMAYNVMAVTAAKDTFIEWESVLTKCLGTLAYSESFVKATEQAGEEKVAMSKEISRITNERLEIIMAAWEDRNVEQDITSQMQSDETGGYERVYDTQTGEIYRAEAGWYESTGSDRYKPVTENKMYAEPISGYIE